MDKYHFTNKSSNIKIGPIPSTMSTFDNCPNSCSFKNNGCYAQNFIMGSIFKKVTNGTFSNLLSRSDLIEKLKSLKDGTVWRMNTMGDLPANKNGTINKNFLKQVTQIAKRTNPICYTHHHDVNSVRWANNNGFNLILSLNDKSELEKYAGIVPTAMVVPHHWQKGKNESMGDYKKRSLDNLDGLRNKFPDQQIFICPATYTDTNCSKCKVCTTMTKNETVCFPGHGAKKRQIKE